MIRLLRRFSPRNPFLAVGYWLALIVVTLVGLFFLFFFLDQYLPGDAMF